MFFLETIQNRGEYYEKIGCPSLYHVLATLIEDGCSRGVFRQVDAWHAAINIVGACCFYFCAAQRLQPMWPGNARPLGADSIAQHSQEAVQMIMRGIRA
jgi:TetR/AcrR family transcriptional regulator